jgi:3-deoxy-D-manno-octulosonic-acid transferase
VEEIILAKGAAIQVKNNFNLNEVLLQLTDDEALRSNLRQKCLNVFEEERKGLEKNLNVVVKYLKY